MNSFVQEILNLASEDLYKAQEKSIAFIESTKNDFLDQLSVNTATDFIGSVLLFSNLCASEKKPWKAVPFLEECWGAVRFLEDYILDRSVLGGTCLALASAFEYANFYPEAKKYYFKAIINNPEASDMEDTVFSYLLMSLFADGKFDKDGVKEIKNHISFEIASLKDEAKAAFEKSIQTDPVERDEAFLAIRYELEAKVDKILTSDSDSKDAFCIRYWNAKKEVLKNDFKLEWKTPAELNPNINFC